MKNPDMHHYTESGLDYIYLSNGFTVEESDWGQSVAVHNVNQLHRAIGLFIVGSRMPIRGQELRFIRHQLGMSQRELGEFVGYSDGQRIMEAERNLDSEISKQIAPLILAIFRESLQEGPTNMTALLKQLQDHNVDDFHQRRYAFSATDTGDWERVAEAA